MSLTSPSYLGFLFGTATVVALAPRRMQTALLIAASLAFYASFAWHFPVVLGVLVVVDFALGRRLARAPSRGVLLGGVAFHLLVLGGFRALAGANPAAGLVRGEGGMLPLLPLGLSFYTLGALSYLVDVHRRQMPAAGFAEVALYLAYFPKLLAGPIERAQAFIPQLRRVRVVDADALGRAASLLAVGLFRKLVLADALAARLPESVWNRPESRSATSLLCWLCAYALVIYNDFAGYSDMARGASALFGIELGANFRRPLFARGFSDLWMRWHISLSSWLRDYIYMPVARALLRRVKNPRALVHALVPPLLTMLASGLWHGATFGMLAWGGLMGVYLAGEQVVRARRGRARPRSVAARALGRVPLAAMALLALVPFRAGFPETLMFWRALLTNRYVLDLPLSVGLALAATLAFDAWLARDPQQRESPWRRWPWPARAALLAVAVAAILLASRTQPPEPFVYQAF